MRHCILAFLLMPHTHTTSLSCLSLYIIYNTVPLNSKNIYENKKKFGGIPTRKEWPTFYTMLSKMKKENTTIFTGAHQVMGYQRFIETMNLLLVKNQSMLQSLSKEICVNATQRNVKGCFEAIQKINNVGKFFAWQVTCDLLESNNLFMCCEDDWVELGPGALAGIQLIFGKTKAMDDLEMARILRDYQTTVFDALGVEFPSFCGRGISLKNIEHALCEFQKYVALVDKARRRSNKLGARCWDPRYSGKGSRSYMDIGKNCVTCNYNGEQKVSILCDSCLSCYCEDCLNFGKKISESLQWICPPCRMIEALMIYQRRSSGAVT
uniref:5-hmdU DNA kinase helical domain-containing protein n=1 Tax=Ditylum brightwellii TaxID=49249 RepID=A0A6S8VZA2_9STRA|mmetsp:Transcript_24121/g.35708  ORF Transcript_24121/g.35708 Transcript_24121/m.35708 type:complete len:323 (+) Transcript_24121:191-1159(+)